MLDFKLFSRINLPGLSEELLLDYTSSGIPLIDIDNGPVGCRVVCFFIAGVFVLGLAACLPGVPAC